MNSNSNSDNSSVSVVVLGCGFGGVEVATELRKRSKSKSKSKSGKRIDITMIDRRTRFDYQAANPEILSGKVTPADISADLYSFANRIDAEFINDEVVDIDFSEKEVKTRTGTIPVPYDYLVIAVGGEQAFFGIPGAEERSHCINTLEGAIKTKEALDELEPGNSNSAMTIAVIGAGLTGVEVAGELVESRSDARVCLVERMPRILPAFPAPDIASFVTRRLMDRGVEILTGLAVEEVKDNEIVLSGQHGHRHRLPYDILIWTAGLKPGRLLERLKLPKVRGWIRVDPYLRVDGMSDVFAVGDNAYFEYDGIRSGQNVEEAEREGKIAAVNIIRTVKGDKLKRYKPKNTIQNPRAIISLGGNTAVIYACGRAFTIFGFGYKLKKFIEHRYMRRFRA